MNTENGGKSHAMMWMALAMAGPLLYSSLIEGASVSATSVASANGTPYTSLGRKAWVFASKDA